MNSHPYLRAYLAGIAFPTFFLLVFMTAYIIFRYVYNVPVPIERVIIFPVAAVPNLWGAWNILYAAGIARRTLVITSSREASVTSRVTTLIWLSGAMILA